MLLRKAEGLRDCFGESDKDFHMIHYMFGYGGCKGTMTEGQMN